jgi:hypothetical protein
MTTRAVIPVGSLLLVRIPFGLGKQVVCNAEVVYINADGGVGVRFQSLSEEAQALLESELAIP